MKLDDLRFYLDFRSQEGKILFQNRRMLIYDADAMGLLRKELVQTLGWEAARRILTRFGYANGYQDALISRELFQWETDEDWHASGPILHTLKGIVQSLPHKVEMDKLKHHFYGEGYWRNSYEAEQHLIHFGRSQEPVCWTLVGYVSGYRSACFGEPVYFREMECVARGDEQCHILGKTLPEWGGEQAAVTAPFEGEDFQREVERLRRQLLAKDEQLVRKQNQIKKLRSTLQSLGGQKDLIYRSKKMDEVIELAMRVAGVDSNVLLLGESGVGKEIIACMIHQRSSRRGFSFVAVNCGALAENLLESELFGYVRGAFTGAVQDKKGLFEEAHRGTLLLDEVGDLSPALQVKLLRALQEKEVLRVGSTRAIPVDTRVIAATNRNLPELVRDGKFRQDLFFRLNVFAITVPPLRERREDILPLARHFLEKFSRAMKKSLVGIAPEAVDLLLSYAWPGNVRELENAIERALILADEGLLAPEHLPQELKEVTPASQEPGSATLDDWERQHILQVLQKHGGNRSKAARELNIGYTTLWRKLKLMGVAE